MPAHDVFHTAVREGLMKEGSTITDDPLIIEHGGLDLYIDLAAEKLVAAEKGDHRIAVEAKTFLGPSLVTDFHVALGQFLNYRIALEEQHPGRVLYLAVPASAYSAFFAYRLAQEASQRHAVHTIVFDPESEVLVRWINQRDTAS
jgi:hypothetical protein